LTSGQRRVDGACVEPGFSGHSQPDHGQTVFEIAMGKSAFKRLGANRRYQNLVELQPLDGGPGESDVTAMRRIEGPAEEGDAHRGIVSCPLYPKGHPMALAYIALGSNLGDCAQTLSFAIDHLGRLGTVTARSSFYETEPVGFRDQPPFLNAVVALETDLEPIALLRGMLAIEREFGRDRRNSAFNGPRTLDLDLLVMEDYVATSTELTLPHPALARRRFVLAPLAEIAPDLLHPVLKQTMADLLVLLPDEGENRVEAVRRLTESLPPPTL
jgi:2-amino-4-hydroxy-6-hydroxymethyldihydropteridine diphosphokinase